MEDYRLDEWGGADSLISYIKGGQMKYGGVPTTGTSWLRATLTVTTCTA